MKLRKILKLERKGLLNGNCETAKESKKQRINYVLVVDVRTQSSNIMPLIELNQYYDKMKGVAPCGRTLYMEKLR
jgi:hypothetical protein